MQPSDPVVERELAELAESTRPYTAELKAQKVVDAVCEIEHLEAGHELKMVSYAGNLEEMHDFEPMGLSHKTACDLCIRYGAQEVDLTKSPRAMGQLEARIVAAIGPLDDAVAQHLRGVMGGDEFLAAERKIAEEVYAERRKQFLATLEEGEKVKVCGFCTNDCETELVSCAYCHKLYAVDDETDPEEFTRASVFGKSVTVCRKCAEYCVRDCAKCGLRDQIAAFFLPERKSICTKCACAGSTEDAIWDLSVAMRMDAKDEEKFEPDAFSSVILEDESKIVVDWDDPVLTAENAIKRGKRKRDEETTAPGRKKRRRKICAPEKKA